MNISKVIRRFTTLGFASMLSAGITTSAIAAPGVIADSPLFISSFPQPNILFMLDDSGSMDWDVLVDSTTYAGNQGVPYIWGTNWKYSYVIPTPSNNDDKPYLNYWYNCTLSGRIGCYIYTTPSHTKLPNNSWRLRNHHYNSMYYNPEVVYTPWPGNDADGNPIYTDITDPENAWSDPGDHSEGTVNLIADINYTGYWQSPGQRFADTIYPAHYFIWEDTDGDGVVDGNDGHTMVKIEPSNNSYTHTSGARTDCANPYNCTYDKEITNFANWFSYYRKREFVTKYAVSKLISKSQNRVGLATIHNNKSIGTVVKDIDDITTPVDAGAKTNKINLLTNLFKINSSGGTPLRVGLRNVGNYYEGVTTGVSSLFGSFQPSPILSASEGGQCQQNFTILMSDGYWNGYFSYFGNKDTDGAGIFDGASYADTRSDTLADVAMHYYERDLADGSPLPSLSDDVPVTHIDVEASNAGQDTMHQHMVTYTVAFGLTGYTTCNPSDRTVSTVAQGWPGTCVTSGAPALTGWPTPVSNELTTVDDMRHAAWNGRGEFLSAGNPQDLVDSLTTAIEDIGARTDTAAAVSFNSSSLQTDTNVYMASFDSADWHGGLKAIELIESGGVLSLGSTVWEAGAILESRGLTGSPRDIVTYNGTSGIAFEWPADYTSPSSTELSAVQINDLLANAPYDAATADSTEIAANQAYGVEITDYLKGDHSNEGATSDDFRDRNDHRLGDIIYSAPYYVGKPNAGYPNLIEGSSHPYSAFVNDWSSRDGMVYVGANDGMLHAFDAESGQEKFAYIPGFLFSDEDNDGLHYLAEQGYTHKYYVDLSPIVADVFIGSAWKTYLVGGVRAGGKGIFVLDVTDPSSLTDGNAANVVKMEYTHADLGYTFSDIRVAKMNNGKWAAVFGNGYNNTGDGTAKLFIVYLDGSPPDIIETNVGSISNGDCSDTDSDCNGMSTPALADLNGDGKVDRIYAGDLKGNMWVFKSTSSEIKTAYGSVGAPKPLFTACESDEICADDNRQPITSKPALARHPTESAYATYPNVMVYFGTGQYISSADNSNTQLQEFYAVWDSGTDELTSSDLVEQTIGTDTIAGGGIDVRVLSDNAVDYASTHGWRIELPTSMERNVVDPFVWGDVVFFNTWIPESGICNQGGYGWLMVVDRSTGGMPSFVAVDFNNDGEFDADDMAGSIYASGTKQDGLIPKSVFIPVGTNSGYRFTGSDPSGVQAGPGDDTSRMSWTTLEY